MNHRYSTRTLNRRDCLKAGVLAPLGISLPTWLHAQASARTPRTTAKACILIWLDGGPSHLETFDPKPDAPIEVRGPFATIPTNVPGVFLSEHLKLTSQICDQLAIVRSVTSPLGEHGLANHYVLTGYLPSPVVQYPSYGAVVANLRSTTSILPSFVAVPESRSAGAGYLGGSYEAFETRGDTSKPEFAVPDLDPYPGVDTNRLIRRKRYLETLNGSPITEPDEALAKREGLAQAFQLVTDADAKRAFRLQEESDAMRARYGSRAFGQNCLLARRLVERGVPFVNVTMTGWDTHEKLSLHLRDGFAGAKTGVGLIPTFDQGFAALIRDLHERGLLEETLVVAMGEFGRTPKLNVRGGRDHWPRVFSIVMAGGGIAGGQVFGTSDRVGESPVDRPVTPKDLAKTIYTLLGVDTDTELKTSDGRPIPINQGGQFLRELTRV
jgi:hypothetical protein